MRVLNRNLLMTNRLSANRPLSLMSALLSLKQRMFLTPPPSHYCTVGGSVYTPRAFPSFGASWKIECWIMCCTAVITINKINKTVSCQVRNLFMSKTATFQVMLKRTCIPTDQIFLSMYSRIFGLEGRRSCQRRGRCTWTEGTSYLKTKRTS